MAVKETVPEAGIEFKDASEITGNKPTGFLFYGGSGSGKTELAASFNAHDPRVNWEAAWEEKVGKVMMMDYDDGMLTVRGAPNITYHTFTEDRGRPTIYNDLIRMKPKIEELSRSGEIHTLVHDSLTTLTEACMNQVLYSTGHVGLQPTFPEWGTQMRYIQDIIIWSLSLPVNVIMTAHEQIQKDDTTGRVWCLPLVTGKLAQRISLYFDEVYHLESGTGKDARFQMLTRPDRIYTAKSRIGYKEAYQVTSYRTIMEAMK